ncbi:hypothetical protein OSSY52_16960 [Tepiditoga spiralis]|uniref:Uncharacterized protein n=1 Tax=Tepiditoga spiralis TaxID=2108365 RepID=A0A7G1G5X5_9BACT|nr:hypothetical protein [Tepiditoga spiralis]BBE31555.1 hypothetical protein OSSY52_16960 [Tepiditoga spiralis]
MSDLSLLIKYSFQNKSRYSKKKKNGKERKPTNPIISIILTLSISATLGLILAPIYYYAFKNSAIPLTKFGIQSTYNFVDIIFSSTYIGLGIMFLMTFSSYLVVNLYDGDMTELFLTMPIKRSTIFLSAAIDSLILSGMPLGMLIPLSIVHAIILKGSIIASILSITLFVYLLGILALIISMLLSLFIGKTAAKRTAMLMSFGSLLIYIISTNLISKIKTTDPKVFVDGIKGALNFILFPAFPHTQMINGINGNYSSIAIMIIFSIIFTFVFYYFSNKMDFGMKSKKSSKKIKNIKISGMPLLKKDLKLLSRDSQSIFMIFYPIALSAIFFFTGNNSITFISIMFIIIAAFYSAYLTIIMLAEDTKIWPLPRLFPVKISTIVNRKIIIPVTIFMLEYFAVLIFLGIKDKLDISGIFFIVPMLIIMFYSSIFGARLFLKNPKRDTKQKNILSTKEIFMLEGVSMGYSLIIFVLLTFEQMLIKHGPFWIFKNIPIIFSHLIFLGIPIILILFILSKTRKEMNKIKKLIESWE